MKKIITIFITLSSLSGHTQARNMSNITESQLKTCYIDSYVKILKEGLEIEDFMIEPDEKKQEKIIRKMSASLAFSAGLLVSERAVHFQELKPFHLIRKNAVSNSLPFNTSTTVEMVSADAKLTANEMEQIFGSVMPLAAALTSNFNDAIARGLLKSIESLPSCSGVYAQ